jgi:hypothetical protein
VVRFNSMTEGPTRFEHGQRWRRSP